MSTGIPAAYDHARATWTSKPSSASIKELAQQFDIDADTAATIAADLFPSASARRHGLLPARSLEYRETTRRGETAAAKLRDAVKRGDLPEPVPHLLIPILNPGPEVSKTLAYHDRILGGAHEHDGESRMNRNGSSISVFRDQEGNTIEVHTWWEDGAAKLARRWFLALPNAEAESITTNGQEATILKGRYTMATTTRKSSSTTPKAPKKATTSEPKARGKYQVFGRPATAVLRRLGFEGMSKAEATAALSSLGVNPSSTTIQIQVNEGRRLAQGKKSSHGQPADLEPAQLAQLLAFRGQSGTNAVTEQEVTSLVEEAGAAMVAEEAETAATTLPKAPKKASRPSKGKATSASAAA